MSGPTQQGVNNYLIMGNQGENARLTVFGRDGMPAVGLVWANPESSNLMPVSDYRAMGYRMVRPKEVETLPGGTWRPENADFGVMFDFDRKADRITTRGGMTLMYADDATRATLKAQQRAMQDLFSRRSTGTEKLRGGASDHGGPGAEVRTEEQVTREHILGDS